MNVYGIVWVGDDVNLDDIRLEPLSGKRFKTYRPDSFWRCADRWHYLQYPYKIYYDFNDRGFRDLPWPQDLKNAVWCLGDSVTVGIGSPFSHTWPQQLAQLSQRRTINLGIRGTNNQVISALANTVIKSVQPRNMVIVWSMFERRPYPGGDFLEDSMSQQIIVSEFEHIEHFQRCVESVNNDTTNIVHAFVPNYFTLKQDNVNDTWNELRGTDWPAMPCEWDEIPTNIQKEIENFGAKEKILASMAFKKCLSAMSNNIGEIIPLDRARDGMHFDILTSRDFAHQIVPKLF